MGKKNQGCLIGGMRTLINDLIIRNDFVFSVLTCTRLVVRQFVDLFHLKYTVKTEIYSKQCFTELGQH